MLIVRFRQTFRERASEWVVSFILCFWGFTVLQSVGLFDRPFYAPLSHAAPQSVWGWGAFMIGLLRLVVLFINGAWWRTPMFRQIGAGFGMMVWIMLMMGALSIEWRSPAIAAYLGLFALDALNLSFASRDAANSTRGSRAHGSE
ncbi:hypothetical protein [Sphingomonas immobilis]|uniref:Uncharacterized protein n=1 Tax=Sphingomonas immobilis TaxID=3063997 RepID=A0ABT8ZU19_9SPHN|nr:hypothetical protein [Sphingomonas sp. CA1-15]MDO7841066.1 hypothetical protein [Sphingomonas sp. CA1-15]